MLLLIKQCSCHLFVACKVCILKVYVFEMFFFNVASKFSNFIVHVLCKYNMSRFFLHVSYFSEYQKTVL